jgi:cytochrome c peroxidase
LDRRCRVRIDRATGRWPAAAGCCALALALAGCSSGDLTVEERAALAELALRAPPPDPTNAVADDPAAARLGQQLFFDPRFSGPLRVGDDGANGGLGPAGQSGLVSCRSCHDPGAGGADRRSRGNTSLGAAWTTRNAPPVVNAALAPPPWIFWDGHIDSLWAQALGPIEGAAEHASSRLAVAHLVYDHYRAPWEALFGPLPPLDDLARFPAAGKPGVPAFDAMAEEDRRAIDRLFAEFGKCIAAYERLLVDRDAPFDRYLRGERGAMSDSAVRGARLFVGRASCNECHRGPTLADGRFHNHGVPQEGPTVPRVDRGRADGIPRVLANPFNAAGAFSDAPTADHLTGLAPTDRDVGAFRTPTLRNLSHTSPYMHTGGFPTLWSVVVWYRDAAGTDGATGTRDPAARPPLLLSDDDLADLVEFLKALDGAPPPADLTTAPVLP